MEELKLEVKKLERKETKGVCTNTSPLASITCCDMGDLWGMLGDLVVSYLC